MKSILLAIAIAAVARPASAVPLGWPDQALPIVLAHPEFFGAGDQQQTGGTGGSQDNQGAGDALPDSLSILQQDHQNNKGDNDASTGSASASFLLVEPDFSFNPTIESAVSGVLPTDAAPIPEPRSVVLLAFALLGMMLGASGECQPARRYCTASSRRNR